ncbi:hypothetical protein [Pseudonocardia nigra]|uniref:hypothetical protein n=1 Tax=Pseudonocardia nigra TaxID=1921578 RepID=UPI001C5E146A|nr:hypothetical protein [Pseudonocardia nigra]
MTRRLRVARYLVDFDSGVTAARSLGRFLRGKDNRGLSVGPGSRLLADLASSPPTRVRRGTFSALGALQGIPLDHARRISADEIAEWIAGQYGRGPYPIVVVGSPSGAAVHLAAALRAPYLPQTTLAAVRDLATHPDDPRGAMQALAPTTRLVAHRNPEVAVYHMHDPAQDRPMLEGMAYLRLKRLTLGRTFERFLAERLAPGGTILVVEATRTWRSHAVGERAYFQFGALGGVPEDEYHDSGVRIADYLDREGSPWRRWDPPEADARRPEAEWGFDPALRPDLERVAAEYGYRLRRLVVDEPQELSAFVADLYRWWYRRRGLPGRRLLVESYVQWDPLWTLRLGAVPFWIRFNMEPSYKELERYLERTEPYDHIHLNLFSQGLQSPGLVPVQRWRELVTSSARLHGDLVGVDEDAYPLDTGSTPRFQPAFAALPPRHPLPAPLDITHIDRFLQATDRSYRLTWN